MKKSFKNELFVSFLVIALFTLVISNGFLISAIQHKLDYDYEKSSIVQLNDMVNSTKEFFDDVEGILEKIIDDDRIIATIDDNDSWHIKQAYNRLFDITDTKRNLATFYLFDKNGQCKLTTSQDSNMDMYPTYWGILKTAGTHPDEFIVKNDSYKKGESAVALSLAKAIVSEEECIGFVLCEMSDRNFKDLLGNSYSFDSQVVVLDGFWNEIYSSEVAKDNELAKTLRTRRINREKISQSEDGFSFYIEEIPERELFFVLGREPVFTETFKNAMLLVIIIMAILAMVLCFFVSGLLSKILMNPIDKMTEAMSLVRQGDLTVQMNLDRQDEFGQLSRDFDDMTYALKQYVELRSQQQQELSESNIAMMQAQLNPHFLYNTLDTIKWVAKANHIPELATLSSSLAKILRASISPDIFVPLSREMELIEHYIDIQKIRFSDGFSFDAEVPYELEDAIVPKLILQPMVENAIVHGLKESQNGHIFLNAYEKDKRLIIDIEDDGCGMSQDMLDILNERNRDKLKGHIGFYNVDTIIRLHYGLNYGLHARNLESGGVRITVELPLKYGEEGYIDNV